MKIFVSTLFALLVIVGPPALVPVLAQDAAGRVAFLRGTAWVQEGENRRDLARGSAVHVGDRLHTGKNSHLQLRFLDDTLFTLGPQAKMNVEVFDTRDGAENSFVTRVLRGAFRFVSGLLAKKNPQSYRVGLTVGTIGVRGTSVAGEVNERREEGGSLVESSARVMLLEDEADEETAIVVANEFGSVVIDQPGFGTEIPDESSPPSPVRRMQLRSVNNLLRAIRGSTRRIRP